MSLRRGISVLIGGAFKRLFFPDGREFEQANLQKFKCPGGVSGGRMLKLRFDWYITTVFVLIVKMFLKDILKLKGKTERQKYFGKVFID